jgi:hypothetical protein
VVGSEEVSSFSSSSSVAVAAVKASETGFIMMSERNLLASHEYIILFIGGLRCVRECQKMHFTF